MKRKKGQQIEMFATPAPEPVKAPAVVRDRLRDELRAALEGASR